MFGVKSVSPTYLVRFSNLDEVADAAARLWGDVVRGRRFAVRVHRWGIHNFTSLDAAAKIGAALVSAGGKVDLERPEVELYVEIRGRRAFLYTEVLEGPRGPPARLRGEGPRLGVRGIDSPVAAWMMMRRGAHVDVFCCNLGGTLALRHVLEVVKTLLSWSYGYNARVAVADCGPLAKAIRRGVREELWNVALRGGSTSPPPRRRVW